MNISDEAVEAAAKAVREQFTWSEQSDGAGGFEPVAVYGGPDEIARAALAAAAPHLMAQAWDEGAEAYPLCDAAVSCGACPVCMDRIW